MRNASTGVVYELIQHDKDVIAVTADNRNEIYDKIRKEYPAQYIDYGIAESNMIASAAGLASCGKIPFLYTITNFMSMRAFEFIRNDVCAANKNVKFLGRSSGLVSSSMGLTHQGTEELSILRALPNLLVITPATPVEARAATYAAYQYDGPVYIRLEGCNELELYPTEYQFEIGKGHVIQEGSDMTIFTMGSIIHEVLAASSCCREQNYSIRVINLPMVKPIDEALIIQAAKETGRIITVEEHSIFGGLGSAVAEVLAENRLNVKFKRMGLCSFAVGCGNRKDIRELNQLSAADIQREIKLILE